MTGIKIENCEDVEIAGNTFVGCAVALSVGGKHYKPDAEGRLEFRKGVLVYGIECDEHGRPL